MKPSFRSLLSGATVLVPLLALSHPSNAQVASTNECDRLITMLERNSSANSSLTLDQARTYKENSNTSACRAALENMPTANNGGEGTNVSNAPNSESAATAGNIVVQQGAPTITVEAQSPQVTVSQPAPSVSINQGQPEITVHQPAPIVTIEIPKPQITVRMPKPTVEVAQAAPEVTVNQPKPEVRVIPQAKPEVSTTTAQANVDTNQQAPIIHFESEQPQVHVTQADGQPTVTVEQIDKKTSTASSATTASVAPSLTASSLSITRLEVTASELTGKNVLGPQGQKLGTVKAVILDAQNRPYIVVERTGIASTIETTIGLLAKEIPIPAENARLEGTQVMIQGLTMAQLNAIHEYKMEPSYRTVERDQTIRMNRS